MKKTLTSVLLAIALLLTCIPLGAVSVSAATSDGYTYTVSNGEATITDYPTSSSYGGAITIPSTLGGYPVTSIRDWAFSSCTSLTSVTIPDSVTGIGYYAFASCDSLTSVTIPDSVTGIGDYAFASCDSLTSVTIPDSVTSIGNSAFFSCDSLTSIDVDQNSTKYCSVDGVLFNKDKTTLIQYPAGKTLTAYSIPDSVTSIGYGAFYDCNSLTSVTIPDSVTIIDSSAFCNCTRLTSVTIGDSVAIIGYKAFEYCDSLTSVTIPDSVTSIGNSAFYSCDSLTSIALPFVGENADGSWATHFGYIFGASSYTGNANYVPASLKEVSITGGAAIDENAFYGCNSLTSVTIGDSVTSIGASAFKGCNSLTSITLPFVGQNADGTGFSNFGYIFGACDTNYPEFKNKDFVPASLKKVTITGSNAIAEKAFYDCDSITTLIFTGNVKIFGEWAFGHCNGLKKFAFPKTCKLISAMAFCDCGNLSNIYYSGSKSQRESISIQHGNDMLIEYAEWQYNSQISKEHVYTHACDKSCNICGATRTVGAHTYKKVITKATTTKNGTIKHVCTKCGYTASKVTTIYKASKVSLSTTTYTYTGSTKKPSVTVKDSKGKTISTAHYTVTYASGRKNVGTYKVTVKFKGNYSGTKTLTFKINPAKTTVKSLTAAKKALTVKWTKKAPQISGYQIQYSTTKSFKSYKTKTVSGYKTTSTKLTGLSAKKTYYVRVRTYKTVNGKKYYSGWSTIKYKKTK